MIEKQNKTIGILGGMGPLASADLFKKIVTMSCAKSDQDHPRVLIDSNTNIPDRTAAILDGAASPIPEMVRSAVLLERGGADVIIMPCNTAHNFYPDICKFVHCRVLNMIEETVQFACDHNIQCVGLLATDGTIQTGVYAREFARHGVDILVPDVPGQKAVMSMIYDGVKAGATTWDTQSVNDAIAQLVSQGAQAIVLGCTEIPIAFTQYDIQCTVPPLDPTAILAHNALCAVDKEAQPISI